MPKLSDHWIKTDRLTFRIPVSVTVDGRFTATLPAEIAQKLSNAGIKLDQNRLGNAGHYEDESLLGLLSQITADVKQFSGREKTEEKLVLRYQIETRCCYCRNKKGEIVPDGGWQQRDDGTYNWLNGTRQMHARSRAPYGFDVFVEPQFKTIYRFPDGKEHVEYRNLSEKDYADRSTLHWLCSVRCMDEVDRGSVKEIDYTDAAGDFFKALILYVINLNEKLKTVFGEDLDIQKAITENKIKLLTLK